jgi:hypothetical protein
MKKKVITLHALWAWLIRLKEKKIETRSWRTLYQGELYIHAGKTIVPPGFERTKEAETIKNTLKKHGLTMEQLPTGVIVAKCTLAGCLPIRTKDELNEMAYLDAGDKWIIADGEEYHFGDYTPGRWGWLLADIQPTDLIPAKGKLGLWDWVK